MSRPLSCLWRRAGWWNNANIFEAMLDYHRLCAEPPVQRCKRIYRANAHLFRGGFMNQYYDDNAWWALAWLKAYEQTREQRYLHIAAAIFADMAGHSWDDKCGGGACWASIHRYKNAVANELYITLAARLAGMYAPVSPERQYYLGEAQKCWQWLQHSGMCNAQHLYNDGLNKECRNNGGNTWTYNQGIILGGLKELYLLSGDSSYLLEARLTAMAAMQMLSDSAGILTEPQGDGSNMDHMQFKGIFIRYLAGLNSLLHDPGIRSFILRNANMAWGHACDGHHRFCMGWQGPATRWSGAATGAALDLMNAAAECGF